MIPLRPCYGSVEDSANLSDADREVCGQTAEIENILLQLLDRCLSVIDTFTVDSGARSDETKMTTSGADMSVEEKIVKLRMDLLWFIVFTQVDDKIAELLMEKLYKSVIFPDFFPTFLKIFLFFSCRIPHLSSACLSVCLSC
jgi:hypothetical protein